MHRKRRYVVGDFTRHAGSVLFVLGIPAIIAHFLPDHRVRDICGMRETPHEEDRKEMAVPAVLILFDDLDLNKDLGLAISPRTAAGCQINPSTGRAVFLNPAS